MSNELKPCPFCGEQPTLVHPDEEGEEYVIGCYDGCCGYSYERARDIDKEKVIAAWDTRYEPSAEWLLHDETNVWECSACHTCFEFGEGIAADEFITYCPVCGIRLYMPE